MIRIIRIASLRDAKALQLQPQIKYSSLCHCQRRLEKHGGMLSDASLLSTLGCVSVVKTTSRWGFFGKFCFIILFICCDNKCYADMTICLCVSMKGWVGRQRATKQCLPAHRMTKIPIFSPFLLYLAKNAQMRWHFHKCADIFRHILNRFSTNTTDHVSNKRRTSKLCFWWETRLDILMLSESK